MWRLTTIRESITAASLLTVCGGGMVTALCQETVITRSAEDISIALPKAATSANTYHALVIGNNDYLYVNKLRTPVNDAKSVAQTLEGSFGFEVTLLQNAKRNDIINALNALRRTLNNDDNLLIFYAGHGYQDPTNDVAYWLPVDAVTDNNVNWISAADITADLRSMPSRHVLIISDSCYSGSLAGSKGIDTITPSERNEYLNKMLSSKSRTLMASGGKEPVPDGSGEHSVFAGSLLEALVRMNESSFTASSLFQEFLPAVAGRSPQTPNYSPIRDSGHEFGDFVFSRKGSSIGGRPLPPPKDPEVDAIASTLHRYKDAYESESVDELVHVWPTLNKQQKNTLKDTFNKMNALRIALSCKEPEIAGEEAHVQCTQVMRYTSAGKVQDPNDVQTDMTLKRSDHGWLVDRVQANSNQQAHH